MKTSLDALTVGDVFRVRGDYGEFVALNVVRGCRCAPFDARLNAPSHWRGPKTSHPCSQCETRDCDEICPMTPEHAHVVAVRRHTYDSGRWTREDRSYFAGHCTPEVERVGAVSAQLGLF